MSPQHRTATRGLGATLRVPGLPDVSLPALLRYSAQDPWAVRLVLLIEATGPDAPESVEWVFSRDLLTTGLVAPSGEGDVHVRVEGRTAVVELAGRAGVLLPLDGLVEFLAESYDVVPTGGESAATGARLEAELVDLLG
ncbi:MAG: putative regulator [Frankiales bacterium]|jgi:hypothetical protein|nr:putative regulator [Frankiales bacterium]